MPHYDIISYIQECYNNMMRKNLSSSLLVFNINGNNDKNNLKA